MKLGSSALVVAVLPFLGGFSVPENVYESDSVTPQLSSDVGFLDPRDSSSERSESSLGVTFDEFLDVSSIPTALRNERRGELLRQLDSMGVSPMPKDSVNLYREASRTEDFGVADETKSSTDELVTYIVGGVDAQSGDAPWQVALVRSSQQRDIFQGQFCGGSFVSPSWIVTAAHCVDDLVAKDVKVWSGTITLPTTSSSIKALQRSGAVLSGVSQIVVHPAWDAETLENDVALLRLSKPVRNAVSIALPRDELTGFSATLTGWGKVQVSPALFPTTLQKATLSHVTDADCTVEWGDDFIPGPMVCAEAAPGVSGCNGDSGGPLATRVGSAWYLVGIVSWGLASCGDLPNVYAKTSSFYDWISCEAGLANPGGPFLCGDESLTIGSTIKVGTGNWGSGKLKYQWFTDGMPIKNAKSQSLKIPSGTYGRTLSVTILDSSRTTTSMSAGVVEEGFSFALYPSKNFLPKPTSKNIRVVGGTYSRIYAFNHSAGANALARGSVTLPRGATQWKWGLYSTYSNCLLGGDATVWEAFSYDGSGEIADSGLIWDTSGWSVTVDYVGAPARAKATYSIAPLIPCSRLSTIYLDYLFAGSWAYYR